MREGETTHTQYYKVVFAPAVNFAVEELRKRGLVEHLLGGGVKYRERECHVAAPVRRQPLPQGYYVLVNQLFFCLHAHS